ncbi:MAG: hypothetical protein ACREEM_49600 [Blastocatellia bacterium]
MKILLDHNLDWRLSRHLPEHEVKTTYKMGWGLLKNGLLLSEAETAGFKLMLTSDFNIKHQQNLSLRSISILVLRAPNNKIETHIEMLDDVRAALAIIQPGQLLEIFHSDLQP